MTKIIVSKRKLAIMRNAIIQSGLYVAGQGHFGISHEEIDDFILALFSNSPHKEMSRLYARLLKKHMGL